RSVSRTYSMVESGLHTYMVSFFFRPSRRIFLPFAALTALFQALGSEVPSIEAALNLLRGLPIVFEPNQGQWNRDVKFSARTSGYRLFLTARGASLSPSQPGAPVVSIALLNANPRAEISGDGQLSSRTSYFLGARRERWRAGVSNYARVRYRSVY